MSQVKTEVVKITPEMASVMLCHNRDNRPVRESNIERYATMMKRGEWLLTHQGVAFDTEGRLVDGQHRLMAIVRSGVTVEMMVSRELDPRAYKLTDQGAKRRAADILHCLPKVAELCNLSARIVTNSVPSPQTLETSFKAIGELGEEIQAYCSSTTFYFSTAAVRLAAVVRLLQGEDKDYVLPTYAALCKGDMDHLSNAGKAWLKMRLQNKLNPNNRGEAIAQGLYVFEEKRADSTKLRTMDPEVAMELTRSVLRMEFEKAGYVR